MNEFSTVLLAVLPVFAIMLAGVLMRKVNWLTEEADQSLLRITVNVLAPCLIFSSILQNDALRNPSNIILPPLVGFGTVGFGLLVGLGLKGFSGLRDRKSLATFALCVGLYNYGYIALPMANSLFDRETVGVLFVHNLGVEIALWTVCLMTLSGTGGGWKKILNPPVLAVLLTLPLNFLQGDRWIPDFILVTIQMLGQCAIPMGIVLIGATMADHLHEFHSRAGWRVMFASCLLRVGIMPVFFLLLAKYLPCSVELKRVIVLQSAMPTAVFSILVARHYGGDAPTALRAVVATSIVGLITIPVWIRVGLKFVGL